MNRQGDMIKLGVALLLFVFQNVAFALDANPAPFSFGPWFKEVVLNNKYIYQPKILNYHSDKPQFLHGTIVFVPKDKNKEKCLGNVIANCEMHLVTNAHGLNGNHKLPEVIIADIDEYLTEKISKEFPKLSSVERRKKKDELKAKVDEELKRLKHPNIYYEDGRLKAKVKKENIFLDVVNDVGIIKLDPILNAVPGEHIEHPRYTKWAGQTYIHVEGSVPTVFNCIIGSLCEYEPWGARGTKLTVVPMSYENRTSWGPNQNAVGPSYLLSPLRSDKIIPYRAPAKSNGDQKFDWAPQSSLISRKITFDARSTHGNSGGLIMQVTAAGFSSLRMTGLLKGHNNYVNESSAIHPTHVYNLIETARNNDRSNLNKCRGHEVQYKYDPETKVTYREVGDGLLSEYLNDKVILSESFDNAGEGGNNAGEGGNNAGEGGNNAGEGGNNAGEGGNNAGEGGNNAGEGGNNAGEGGNNAGEGGNNSLRMNHEFDPGMFYSSTCDTSSDLLQIEKINNLSKEVLKVTKPVPGLSYQKKPVLGFWMTQGRTKVPVFANEEFINLYCETDIKFEPMNNISFADLFYKRMNIKKKDSLNEEICFPSYQGQECLNISKPEGKDEITLSTGDSRLTLNLANLTQENFQYWFPLKNGNNRVSHLIDLREFFFVDSSRVKMRGVNAEDTGSSIFPDSFSKDSLAPTKSRIIKEAIVNDYKKTPNLQVSRVLENNDDGFNETYQKILGDRPIEVPFKRD